MTTSTPDAAPTALEAEPLAAIAGIRHGFFTRLGGVSRSIYASLNCGYGSSDNASDVAENRRRVAAVLGVASRGNEAVLTIHQIHSANAVVVDRPLPRGSLPKADAIVTRTRGLVVAALAADCAPVLFADPEARVVAAAHAGWRGALAGITDAAIASMETLGASRRRIVAAVGPCIGQSAYEVGSEFEATFLNRDPAYSRFFARPSTGGRPHFDLPGFVAYRLHTAGLAEVALTSPCTYTNDSDFFSFRRTTHRGEPDYGRHISAIVVT
jgi:YfiH family protein